MKRSRANSLPPHPLCAILSAAGLRPVREALVQHLKGSSVWALGRAVHCFQLDVTLDFTAYWNAGIQELVRFCTKRCLRSAEPEFRAICWRFRGCPNDVIVSAIHEIFDLTHRFGALPCHGTIEMFWNRIVAPRLDVLEERLWSWVETAPRYAIYLNNARCCNDKNVALDFFWNNVAMRQPDLEYFARTIAEESLVMDTPFAVVEEWVMRVHKRHRLQGPDWMRLYTSSCNAGHVSAIIAIWTCHLTAIEQTHWTRYHLPSVYLQLGCVHDDEMIRLLKHLAAAHRGYLVLFSADDDYDEGRPDSVIANRICLIDCPVTAREAWLIFVADMLHGGTIFTFQQITAEVASRQREYFAVAAELFPAEFIKRAMSPAWLADQGPKTADPIRKAWRGILD